MEEILKSFEDLQLESKNDPDKLSSLIDTYLIPTATEKKKNAEISTPYTLRQEMLDKVPEDFWKTPQKVLEPCCGKGGFVIDVYRRFKQAGLDDRTIIEECIYFADINPLNIYITELVLHPEKKYKVNKYIGDTLKMEFDVKFDLVVGNPPYNDASGNKGSGHNIWTKFIDLAFTVLKKDRYLVYVHPAGWRQVGNKYLTLLKSKQIEYLEIHNAKDGKKIFNCATRYDWYFLKNCKNTKKTVIKDEEGIVNEIDLKEWSFIPNMMFGMVQKLITVDKEDRLNANNYRSSYGADKKWVCSTKNEIFKYPVVYSINAKNKLSLKYSNTNKNGHFGESKFIFSNGNGIYIDLKGEYGLSQWAYCIYDSEEKLDLIYKVFSTSLFQNIKRAIQLDSSSYNIKVLKLFKKDFYKEISIEE